MASRPGPSADPPPCRGCTGRTVDAWACPGKGRCQAASTRCRSACPGRGSIASRASPSAPIGASVVGPTSVPPSLQRISRCGFTLAMRSLSGCARLQAAHQQQSLAPVGEPAAENVSARIAASAEVRVADITAELGQPFRDHKPTRKRPNPGNRHQATDTLVLSKRIPCFVHHAIPMMHLGRHGLPRDIALPKNLISLSSPLLQYLSPDHSGFPRRPQSCIGNMS